MDKSYVTLEQQICIVCGIPYDTGSLLMDTRLRPKFEKHTVTGNGLCPEHQKLHDDGFLALVAADPTKSQPHGDGDVMKPEHAYRTGAVMHIRRTVAREIFNVPVPDETPMMFVDPAVITKIQAMMTPEGPPEATPGE